MQTVLTDEEIGSLTERIARWAVSLRIGSLLAFLLEINRPVAPISGNLCIAVSPIANGLMPLPLHSLGLLLQDDKAVIALRDRILQLEREAPG